MSYYYNMVDEILKACSKVNLEYKYVLQIMFIFCKIMFIFCKIQIRLIRSIALFKWTKIFDGNVISFALRKYIYI